MYDPLRPQGPEINRKELISGALVLASILGLLLCAVAGWYFWAFVYKPDPQLIAQQPSDTPAPSSTPGPTQTLVMRPGLAFRSLILETLSDCRIVATSDLVIGNAPIPNPAEVDYQVFVNRNPVPIKVTRSGDRYRVEFSGQPLCGSPGIVQINARVGGEVVSRSIYAGGEWTSTEKLSSGTIQIDADKYPNLVAYFSVTDPSGIAARLKGLIGIQVFQDGTEITDFVIDAVDVNRDPVTVALALDASGSMKGDPLANARQAATEFVRALGSSDTVCIYTFSTAVAQIQKCTSDRQAAANSLNQLNAVGNTALHDTLVAIANDHAKRTGRQAIIVLSDGADTASKATLSDALARIKQTNIPFYMVGLINKDLNKAVLQQFATTTGGIYLEAPAPADLKGLYARIQGQLKNQYRVTFRSRFPERTSGTVTIRLANSDQTIEASRVFFVK